MIRQMLAGLAVLGIMGTAALADAQRLPASDRSVDAAWDAYVARTRTEVSSPNAAVIEGEIARRLEVRVEAEACIWRARQRGDVAAMRGCLTAADAAEKKGR